MAAEGEHAYPRLQRVRGAGEAVCGGAPALGGQLGAGNRVVGPPVTVGEQVDGVAAGQGDAANPENGHHATLTTATAGGTGGGQVPRPVQ